MNAGIRKAMGYGLTLLAGVGLGWVATRPKPRSEVASLPLATFSEGLATATRSAAGAREFLPLSAVAAGELKELIRQFRATGEDRRRLEILDRIEAGCYGKDFLGVAREVLDQDGKISLEVRLRVLEMLAGNTSPETLSVLDLVRSSPSEEERRQAVLSGSRVRDQQVVDFIAGFFGDTDKSVRFAALDSAVLQPPEYRETLLVRAMHGAYGDAGLAALAELELDASLSTMPLILQGLASPNAEVRDEALRTAGFLLDEDFENPAAALAWWDANRQRFDRHLNRIE